MVDRGMTISFGEGGSHRVILKLSVNYRGRLNVSIVRQEMLFEQISICVTNEMSFYDKGRAENSDYRPLYFPGLSLYCGNKNVGKPTLNVIWTQDSLWSRYKPNRKVITSANSIPCTTV